MVYVVQTPSGLETLKPDEMARAYGWKNDVRWVRFSER